jgi:polysaccharide export outer membrane protein
LIGKDDLVEVTVFEVPELNSTSRVSAAGLISLPLIGPVDAAGVASHDLELRIEESLRKKALNDPHVTVFVREYASQPVSVVGAVRAPGIYQIKGEKFLLDVLAQAQGLDMATAGNTIQIMRRATDDSPAETITISVEDLSQNGKSELNVPIQAGDTINVLQAGSIFVVGEVPQPGEFVLRQGKPITVAQAVARAGGFGKEAKKHQCLIVRLHRDNTKEEIPVNAAKILDGSLNDVPLMPNDILFVPANKVKTGLTKALDTAVATLAARAIYRF